MRKILILSLIILLSTTGCESVKNVEDFKELTDKNVTNEEVGMPEKIEDEISYTKETVKSENIVKEEIKVDEIPTNSNNKNKSDNSITNDSVENNNTSNQSKNKNDNSLNEPVKEPENKTPTNNNDVEVNYTDKSNDLMYSITHGVGEYSSESECISVGDKIKIKELDSVMDWNEVNPEQMKQPVIKSSMCIAVIKDNKEYWFLHFITVSGNNMDAELKELYKQNN